MAPTEIHEPI